MSESSDEVRARITIDGQEFAISPDRDLVDLMQQLETAAGSRAAFVHIHGGDESISVLVTPHSKIVLAVDHIGAVTPEDEAPFTATPEERPFTANADWEYW
jgi:hypothetical protein